MARLASASVQWWVIFTLGAAGFVKVMTSTMDPVTLATCVGMMSTPAVFGKGKSEDPSV